VFDTVDLYPGPTGGGPMARALAGKMSRSWSGFARNGNPDASGLPHWPAYALDTRATMVFDNESKVVNDLDHVAVPAEAPAAPKRRPRTAAQRKVQAERMKAYWARRRKEEKKG